MILPRLGKLLCLPLTVAKAHRFPECACPPFAQILTPGPRQAPLPVEPSVHFHRLPNPRNSKEEEEEWSRHSSTRKEEVTLWDLKSMAGEGGEENVERVWR